MYTYEFHRKLTRNVGDRWCNPSRYFQFENLYNCELTQKKLPINNNIIIIGGGGLVHKKFIRSIEDHLNQHPRLSVIWGIGHNFNEKHFSKTKLNNYYPEWLLKCSLVGIRDWIDGLHARYLPCASCMHDAFSECYEVKNEVVYFTHSKKSKYIYESSDIHMTNSNLDINEVIKFLGSANIIVTDSYHGAYWGQLLGKDVKVVSWSTKFKSMKYPPTFIDNIRGWKHTKKSYVPENFLIECRNLNKEFYQQYMELKNSIS